MQLDVDTKPTDVLRERQSVRRFGASTLDTQTIEAIIEDAAWAPSGGNLQPWKVAVLGPQAVRELLACSEPEALDLVEPMAKLALLGRARREQESPPPGLNDFVVSCMNPLMAMSEAPPSHILAVYYQRLGIFQRLWAITESASLVWHRFCRLRSMWARLRYGWTMISSLFRMLEVDRTVQIMSLSSFVFAITIAAQQRGFGSCIQCHFTIRARHIRRILQLESDHDVLALVSLGRKRAESETGAATTHFPRTRYAVPTTWIDTLEKGV